MYLHMLFCVYNPDAELYNIWLNKHFCVYNPDATLCNIWLNKQTPHLRTYF